MKIMQLFLSTYRKYISPKMDASTKFALMLKYLLTYQPDKHQQNSHKNFTYDCNLKHIPGYFGKIHDNDYIIFKNFTNQDDIFIDIGANGGYSATSIWATGSKMSVLAFEPIVSYEDNLNKIKTLAKFPYDFCICGLSNKNEIQNFYIPICNNLAMSAYTFVNIDNIKQYAEHFLRQLFSEYKKSYNSDVEDFRLFCFQSPVFMLDIILEMKKFAFAINSIAVIKIDAEGHDPYVIRGAHRTLERHRPLLLLEHVNPECRDFLGEHDYVEAYRHGDFLSLDPAQKDNEVNTFFLPREKLSLYLNCGHNA